jgi:hypothetical protein
VGAGVCLTAVGRGARARLGAAAGRVAPRADQPAERDQRLSDGVRSLSV